MPMPSGAVAVKSFRGELLQSMNESWVQSDAGSNYDEAAFEAVPLSQLYNHHWIMTDYKLPPYSSGTEEYNKFVRDGNKSFAAGPCESLKFSFGGGSEMKSTPFVLPDPYYYVLTGEESFG